VNESLSTPWPDLNAHIDLHPGALILLAGPVSSGTSMAALNIATHIGFDLGHRVLLYSTEINHHGTMSRIISERLGIDSAKMHNGGATEQEMARIKAYGPKIADTLVEIWEDSPVNIPAIRKNLQNRASSDRPTRLVMVDGLELVAMASRWNSEDGTGRGQQQIVALRDLAREFGVTIVATAHLSRRISWEPQATDLVSGLGEAADTVLLLHSPAADEVVVTVAKNRQGESGGRVRLSWQPEFTRLRSYGQV
jgi:replicative DNA helicase